MKQIFLMLFLAIFIFNVKGQETSPAQAGMVRPKMWGGISYTYANSDMKLYSRTNHNVWQGVDYGSDTLSDSEIDAINSIARFTSENNAVCLEFGLILLNKPDGKWYIDGNIFAGITGTKYETINQSEDSTDFSVVSPFARACGGMEFLFRYSLSSHWGIAAAPTVSYAFGSSTDITDRFNQPVENFSDSRKEKFRSLVSRISILASYSIKDFTFSAGPGFYMIYNHREYTTDLTNPEGSTYHNESISDFYNKNFADAAISVEWRIIPSLRANIYCGIGNDLIIHPSIRYFF